MVCLDTAFLVDVIKGRVKNELDKMIENDVSFNIASPSIMELFKGLHLTSNLKHATSNEFSKIQDVLSSMAILNLDKDSAILAGKIEADLINKGEIIEIEDIMIGSICIVNHEGLLTKNIKHFEKMKEFGLKVVEYSS
ncbi:MAG: PIN domain-containing protein [Nanoarchaeota archaeon]|mgnify:CR=1 FL=1